MKFSSLFLFLFSFDITLRCFFLGFFILAFQDFDFRGELYQKVIHLVNFSFLHFPESLEGLI